jgi:hypothetical protein
MKIDEKFTFAFAAYLLNQSQDIKASKDESERRMSICQKCDKFQLLPPPTKEEVEEQQLMKRYGKIDSFHGCTVCGCFLEAKVETLFEKCPEMKWWPTINFVFDSGMKFNLEGGRKGQQGDIEQWKKYHEDFMKLYEEKGENFLGWIDSIYGDIIESDDIIEEELPGDENE